MLIKRLNYLADAILLIRKDYKVPVFPASHPFAPDTIVSGIAKGADKYAKE